MIGFACHVCRTALTAEDSQAGRLLRCPTCLTTLRAPALGATVKTASAPAPPAPPPDPVPLTTDVDIEIPSDVATAPVEVIADETVAVETSPISPPIMTSPVAPPTTQRSVTHEIASAVSKSSGARRYGFNCVYCSSRLEATAAMAAQEGQCPTCGNTITIPILDRHGRLIDPITKEIIKQDPHPVHAYAAAGDRAPAILRGDSGQHLIRCPRCSATSPIVANNCKACGMPFTMEGTTQEAAGTSNGFCTASLVLGIVGLVAFCAVIPPVLAVIFGIIGYNQVTRSGVEGNKGSKGVAIAGMICGGLGCLFGFMYYGHGLF